MLEIFTQTNNGSCTVTSFEQPTLFHPKSREVEVFVTLSATGVGWGLKHPRLSVRGFPLTVNGYTSHLCSTTATYLDISILKSIMF